MFYLKLTDEQALRLNEVMSEAREDSKFYKAFWTKEEEEIWLGLQEIIERLK